MKFIQAASAKTGSLTFPNPSRSYDDTGRGVRFWGYDRTFEIAFLIESGALSKLDRLTKADEAGYLGTFDLNHERICDAASVAYARRRSASRTFSYTLSDSDF